METNEKNAEVLNDLLRINNDRIEGYEKAIKETKDVDNDLRETFRKMVDESRKYADELKKEISQNGGKAAEDTTAAGKIYRAWMDLKTTASGNSRESVLNVCERGEDAAQNAYKNALEEKTISLSARSIISNQQSALRSSHDVIKQWRDRERAVK